MAEDRLTAWCLATCNVAVLTVVSVLLLHVYADLGLLLSGLDTLTGLALFCWLWALALWTNDRVLAGIALFGPDRARPRTVLWRALRWGGVLGACFLWGVLAIVFLPDVVGISLLRDGPELVGILLVASLLAAVVGSVLGLLVGVLDLLLVGAVTLIGGSERPASDEV